MQIRLQEHDPEKIIAIFRELEKSTGEPFKQMKAGLDTELAARFDIKPEEMMPWHYDNPFFQAAPPSEKVNPDEFYEKKEKEDIVALANGFYKGIGLPIEDITARSDLYEREGKQQHAFCISLDMAGDTRVLVNIKPTADWMGTMLHEMGHGVYYKFSDNSLPFNLRDAAHIFTTEAMAMLMGALANNPAWMVTYAGADEKRVKEVETAILEQRRREQLIFTRWTLVMLNFEKAMYENPEQDLNKLWWDMVERYQSMKRPAHRDAPDWASKPHFTIAPVYYHNYMLGELFASQLRNTLVKIAKHDGPPDTLDYSKHMEFGPYFKEKIFRPCATKPWPEFVVDATGEALTAAYFAAELK
jgi:peptidyl-dipeptidase A